MKQKSQNRFFAALLAVAMMLQMLPLMAFADEGTSSTAGKARIGATEYDTLLEAVQHANDGDTITLGEGVYSLGGTQKVTDKSLTFVGAGADKTTWQIQAPQAPYGADGYCNYSFDGSDSITFRDMTVIGSVYPDGTIKAEGLQGYVRIQNITLKDCVFNGRADYWGYTSTKFDNVTFNSPGTTESEISSTNYSLWTYTGKTYTFRDCTFNSTGKTINVYRHGDPGYDVTVNFENCTVNSNFATSAKDSKTALSIGDHTFGSSKYILNIINPHVTAARDKFTCSQVFGFGDNSGKNTGRTEVYWNNSAEPVWKDGKMQTHSYIDVVNHTLTVTGGIVTVKNGDKDVTDTLTVTTDEATGKKTYSVPKDAKVTVTLDKTLIPEGMVFDIWSTGKFSLPLGQDYKAETITFTMSSDVDIAAQYRDATIEDDGPGVLGTVAIIGTAAVGGAVLGYQAYSLGAEFAGKLMALPYFPSNRSALAMMLWEDAGKPMPESEILYPDVGQEEQDMDLQHAARWAMEHDLLPDLNDQDTELPPEQVKFYPDNMVTKISVLRAWKKAQDLKQNAQ